MVFGMSSSCRYVIFHSISIITILTQNQGPTPKNDFCRIFSRSKILSPLALVLDRVLDEKNDKISELIEGRIVNIFYLFSQAENYVKEVVADRVVLKRKFLKISKHIWTKIFQAS